MKLEIKKLKIEVKKQKIFNMNFNKKIIFIYGKSQIGKSTIAKSIMTAFGYPISFNNDKLKSANIYMDIIFNHNKLQLTNAINSSKLDKFTKKIEFKEINEIKIPSNSKYKEDSATISLLMFYFYISQQKVDTIMDKTDKLINSINYLKYYLINPKQYKYNKASNEYAKLSLEINNIKKSQKINDVIDKVKNNINETDNLDNGKTEILNTENNIENLEKKIYSLSLEKRKLKNKLFFSNRNLKLMMEINKNFKNLSMPIENSSITISIYDILKYNNKYKDTFLNPIYSLEEYNKINDQLENINFEISNLNLKLKEEIDKMSNYNINSKIYLYADILKELLAYDSNIDINDKKQKLKEIEAKKRKIDKEKNEIINKFDNDVSNEVVELGFQNADQGTGQQIRQIIEKLKYQINVQFPILFDGAFDQMMTREKIKSLEYIIKKSNSQVFIFYTIQNENNDDFLKFVYNEYKNKYEIDFVKIEDHYIMNKNKN